MTKTLTLWQPWASLVAVGAKTIETRSWPTRYRGRLLIHAARSTHASYVTDEIAHAFGLPSKLAADRSWWGGLPLGAIVASCTLADVVPIIGPDDDPCPGGNEWVAHVAPGKYGAYKDRLCLWRGGGPYNESVGRETWRIADVDFIAQVFMVMQTTPRHTFQVLTKRPQRMAKVVHEIGRRWLADVGEPWPAPNVWLGTSVENQRWTDIRVKHLLSTPAAVRFLSVEPMLGPVDLRAYLAAFVDTRKRRRTDERPVGVDWVIVGGESGPRARPMHPEWVRTIRSQCDYARVPLLFKQWGEWAPNSVLHATARGAWVTKEGTQHELDATGIGAHDPILMRRVGKHAAGRKLDGRLHDDYPEVVR